MIGVQWHDDFKCVLISMSNQKTRPLLFIFLLLIAAVLAGAGAVQLYYDFSSILGYALLGVGLGGFIAGLGEFFWNKDEQ